MIGASTVRRVAIVAVVGLLVLAAGCGRPSPDQRASVFTAQAQEHLTEGEKEHAEFLKYFPDQPGGIDLVVEQMLWGWDRTGPYGWMNKDGATEHTVVREGKRASYELDDPDLTVWLFGGSTAFGVGQRTDHTIASQIVRIAQQRGHRLRVVNHGVSGYVNWQGSQYFIDELEAGGRPDVAIFLDGANETALAIEREAYGLLDPAETYHLSMEDDQRALLAQSAKARGYTPTGDLDLAARVGAEQYRRGVEAVRAAGEAHGVETLVLWQPHLYTMPLDRPLVVDALEQWDIDQQYQQEVGELARRLAAYSGVDPVDLTGIFDDVDAPVFFDVSHCNEFGALVQAEAIVEVLLPLLRENR